MILNNFNSLLAGKNPGLPHCSVCMVHTYILYVRQQFVCLFELIHTKNRSGPRIDPWGTPHLTRRDRESIVTYCFRLLKQLLNHKSAEPRKPQELSLENNVIMIELVICWKPSACAFSKRRMGYVNISC